MLSTLMLLSVTSSLPTGLTAKVRKRDYINQTTPVRFRVAPSQKLPPKIQAPKKPVVGVMQCFVMGYDVVINSQISTHNDVLSYCSSNPQKLKAFSQQAVFTLQDKVLLGKCISFSYQFGMGPSTKLSSKSETFCPSEDLSDKVLQEALRTFDIQTTHVPSKVPALNLDQLK